MSTPKPELLAPAGSFESVLAAVRCGADAVYAGGTRFSARANAENFSDAELEKAVRYCHLHGVKLYRAMNTLVFGTEMADFVNEARRSAEIGVDGLIVQDLGAARVLREVLPDMRLHASTQMTVHTPEGARLAAELGFARVVAARELSLKQIQTLTETGIETEVFVHGALCMSVSGQCYMSALIGSRSANRGMCAQACRLPIGAIKGERYDLSLKDLCVIPHIGKLAEIGVSSLKIEGRMKRAEYVAAAVTACRAALDGGEPDLETLQAVFSRSGFTDGYLTGETGAAMFGYRRKEDVTAAEAVLPELRELYRKESKRADGEADFTVKLKRGEPARLEMSRKNINVFAEGAVPQTAKNRPADEEFLRRQLEKLGDTVYTLNSFSAEIDEGLAVSAAAVNALRREAVQKMDEAVIAEETPKYLQGEIPKLSRPGRRYPEKIRARVSNWEQLEAVYPNADEIVVPINIKLGGLIMGGDRFILSLPRFVDDEERLKKDLDVFGKFGFTRILCTNISHIKIGRELGFTLSGDFGLNLVNPYSVKAAEEMGLADITAGFEAKLGEISQMCGTLPVGVIVYGRLPAMLTKNCPIRQAVGDCKNCTGFLTDRTGRRFPVRCEKERGRTYSEVLNSDVLMMTDRLDEISADFAVLNFTDESPEETARVIECCKARRKCLESGFTRGLYYRGVN
ncbi:MAG: U32 family peptidase [Ruminococcus sp.]|nr:U32 family peptidase [Ruminococcus sp.]MCM1382258.1 U32 family peptidase [Muribaculaceae bacterium]MCM1478438.1 U32 family peptidase [Muribaculaceae bacterium]